MSIESPLEKDEAQNTFGPLRLRLSSDIARIKRELIISSSLVFTTITAGTLGRQGGSGVSGSHGSSGALGRQGGSGVSGSRGSSAALGCQGGSKAVGVPGSSGDPPTRSPPTGILTLGDQRRRDVTLGDQRVKGQAVANRYSGDKAESWSWSQ
ncbi:hypothetical protein DPX16_14881 [Anabarilius grahami]|uniref:Uncharacterized protein n=1 Tax=Anabarilius grahami TaxID=495550 RepID=A0A3N0YWM7_ANAGA|nr:hypothetical protein DPX16_14881 [Anabarilius grahami]